MRAALLVVLSLAACTDFDSLDRGVCGNGIIEEGEDCDSSDASCVRCAVGCDETHPCPTSAYACGNDGLCHAPGGTLAAPQNAGPFQVNEYRIADITEDGAGDVVGLSRTSIVVREGDPSGILSARTSLVTPFQTGRPAFGDLDDDKVADITLATPDGLVSYTSPLGELTPLPVSSSLADGGGGGGGGPVFELAGLYRLSNEALGAFLSGGDGRIFVSVFDIADSTQDQTIVPCSLAFDASKFGEQSYDLYRLNADTDQVAEAIMTITGKVNSGENRTCVLAITKQRNQKATIVDITPNVMSTTSIGRAVVADLDFDADKCPGVVVAHMAGGFRYYDGSRNLGACTLAPTGGNYVLQNSSPGVTLVSHFPLSPGIALTANDVIVASDGVYVHSVVGTIKAYSSVRRIARVDFGDLDGDGYIDGVVASEGEDDIDLLYRTDQPGYQLVRLDTASRVTSLTVADFDGNGIEDIAYTELIDQYRRLSVSFCTTDRPLDPITVGAFPNNISLIRLQIPDSLDPQGLASDLAVLTLKTGARPPTVTVLHGSSQRTLLPYYDPSPDSTNLFDGRKPFLFRGLAAGRFAGDSQIDVAGIASPLIGHADTPALNPPAPRAFAMKGTITGPDGSTVAGKPLSGMHDCALMGPGSDLCLENAFYLTWNAGDHDQVIVFDGSDPPRAGLLDPASVNSSLPVTPIAAGLVGPAGSTVQSAFGADVDGDGTAELVAAYAPTGTGDGKIAVCKLSGTSASCESLQEVIKEAITGITTCVDAAPGAIHYRDPFSTDDDTARELVVLCRGSGVSMLERVRKTATGYAVDELARVPGQLEAIQIGDVTGDGVDDVAAIRNEFGAKTLEVFRQCTSRDAKACRGGGQ